MTQLGYNLYPPSNDRTRVAAVARKELESKTGKSVVTPLNASTFFTLEGKQPEKQITDEEKIKRIDNYRALKSGES